MKAWKAFSALTEAAAGDQAGSGECFLNTESFNLSKSVLILIHYTLPRVRKENGKDPEDFQSRNNIFHENALCPLRLLSIKKVHAN